MNNEKEGISEIDLSRGCREMIRLGHITGLLLAVDVPLIREMLSQGLLWPELVDVMTATIDAAERVQKAAGGK